MIRIAKEDGFDSNVQIVHAQELFRLVDDKKPLNKEYFLETINQCHEQIDSKFAHPDDMVRKLIREDLDSLRTYQQMSKYLEEDLRYSVFNGLTSSKTHRLAKVLARKVMARSEAFGKIVREARPHHVRLSVHASSGAQKLSFPLVPQADGKVLRVPWMSTIAINQNGESLTVRSQDVKSTHDLVYKYGRPWCYVERREV